MAANQPKTSNGSGVSNVNLNLTNIILVAKFDYESKEPHELDLRKNERLILIDNSKNWWLVKKCDTDQTGYVPSNYVKKEKKSILDKIMPRKHHSTPPQPTTTTTTNPVISKSSVSADETKLNKNGSATLNFISKAVVKHKYNAQKEDELTLNTGIEVKVLEKFGDGWWKIAAVIDTKELIGLYPSNYLRENTANANNINNYSNMPIATNKMHPAFDMYNQDSSNPAKCESISSNEKEIEYVRVRYAHTAGASSGEQFSELSVSVNEILRVVEDDNESMENDKTWLKVFNSHGCIGLIPYNCVEPILDHQLANFVFIRRPAKTGMFVDKSWYFGNITRFDTIILFDKYAASGDYLVRDSDNGTFSISLKADGSNVKHFKINVKENKFTIGKKMFDSMDNLIQYYHKNPIFDQNGEKLYLIKPFDPPLQNELVS